MLGKVAAYGASRSVVEGLLAGRGFLLASILGPELFGVWALFRIYLRYLGFAALGLVRGVELEVSRASSDPAEQTLWGRTAAGHTLLLYGGLSLVAAALWAWGLPHDGVAHLAVVSVAIALLFDRYWTYGHAYLRASGGLRKFAIVELIQAALQVLLSVGLALRWGLIGAVTGFAIANLLGVLVLSQRVPFAPRIDGRRLMAMIRVGFPISLMGILMASLATVDRLLVGAFLGLAGLGVYAFAVAVSELATNLAMVVRTVILRDVYADQPSVAGGAPEGAAVLGRALAGYTAWAPPLAVVLALLLPIGIRWMPGDYDAAGPAAQLLVFTGLMQGLGEVAVLGVVAGGRQARLPLLAGAAVGLNATLSLGALLLGWGLVGVAASALLTRLVYAGGIVMLLDAAARGPSIPRALVRFLGPTVLCAAAVAAIGQLL